MSLRHTILRTSLFGLFALTVGSLSTGCMMDMDLDEGTDYEDELAGEYGGDEKPVDDGEDSFKDSKCSDVDIHVHNQFVWNNDNKDIKVIDFSYYDYEDGKWRNESTTNKIIGWGGSATWNKALEYVGGEYTKIRVHFKYNLGGTSWSSEFTRTGPQFFCYDGYHADVTVQ